MLISFGCLDSLAEFSCFGSSSQKGPELHCKALRPFARSQPGQWTGDWIERLPPSLGLLSPFSCPRAGSQFMLGSERGCQSFLLFLFLPVLSGEQSCWSLFRGGFSGFLRRPACSHHSQSQVDPGVSHLFGLFSWPMPKMWVS